MDIRHLFSKFKLKFFNKTKGYVVLLLVVFVPLIMLGTKLALDLMTLHDVQINMRKPGGRTYRRCAKQAALAVAENWNPGVGLDQQKTSLLKIADRVYNDNPSFDASSELSRAVPGIQISVKKEVITGKAFDPIRVTTQDVPTNLDLIRYKSADKYTMKKRFSAPIEDSTIKWNLPFVTWKLIDNLTSSSDIVYDKFDELDQTAYQSGKYVLNHIDRYQYPHQWHIKKDNGYPTRDAFLSYAANSVDVICTITSSSSDSCEGSGYSEDMLKKFVSSELTYTSQGNSTKTADGYTYREEENDKKVQLSVENDKIKVVTALDSWTPDSTGYAMPAECNVDIVLACPTNAAACNNENRDINTPDVGYPYSGKADTDDNNIKSCPIYQIGQAFRVFAKEFYHIRGVTMGLIPYSGKVSLSPDIAEQYTEYYARYNGNACFQQNNYSENQSTYQPYLRPYVLYDSYGLTDKELNNDYKWNTMLTGCPIRCRCGLQDANLDKNAGGNVVYTGNILSEVTPIGESSNTAKFWRQNSNPCYGGCANLLSMRCDKNCTVYLPNPYYIIEPTANIQKIYEICGALYPFYDEHNISNFLFIPISWANNLWQDWTRNPEFTATNTDESGKGGQLSIPSKMKDGRKKVLILVVNKPDWFEPQELTYLGFDNDYSELPMLESDHIRFAMDYTTENRKYADGTLYDGTIQGQKKLLKFTCDNASDIVYKEHTNANVYNKGYYECKNSDITAKCHLSFPKKYLVKVVVEPLQRFRWIYKGNFLHLGTGKTQWNQLTYNGSSWMAVNNEGYTAVSTTDAVIWSNKNRIATANQRGIAYGNGTYVSASAGSWGCYVSHDGGNSWTLHKLFTYDGTCDVAFGNSWWFVSNYWAARSFSKDNGDTWDSKQDVGKYFGARKNFFVAYLNGTWMALSDQGEVQTTTDLNGENWTWLGNKLGGESSKWKRLCGANGRFVALSEEGISASSKDNGQTWEYSTIGNGSNWTGISYGQDKFVACSSDGDIAFSDIRLEGSIQFSNISSSTDGTTENECTINEKREFYIEPSQIPDDTDSDGSYHIDFSLKNIRLISAEITNRPYNRIKAECTLEGTNIKTNCVRPLTVKVSPPIPSVTFSNLNNSNISNGGTHTIKESTTFTFPSSNFSNNYENEKIEYSLDKARIADVRLTNRYIRAHGTGLADNAAIKENFDTSNYGVADNNLYPFIICIPLTNLTLVDGINLSSTHSGVCKPYSFQIYGNNNAGSTTLNWNYKAGYSFRVKLAAIENSPGNFLFTSEFTGWKNQGQCTYPPSSQTMGNFLSTSTSDTPYLFIKCTAAWVSGNSGTGTNYFYCYYSNDYTLNNGITINSGKISFNCTGDLSVTVEPTISSSTITHTTPTGSNITESYTGDPQTITIDPDNYKYEDDGKGNYTIKLTTNNITLSDLQLIDKSDIFEWGEMRIPDKTRLIDFTQKTDNDTPAYYILGQKKEADNNYLYYQQIVLYGHPGAQMSWNNNGYWQMPGDYWGYTRYDCMLMNYPGDLCLISNDISESIFLGWTRHFTFYTGSGLCREYCLFGGGNCHNIQIEGLEDFYKHTTLPLLMISATMPINTALYYGTGNSNAHEYEWQSNKDGTLAETTIEISSSTDSGDSAESTTTTADMVVDATTAAAKVTLDACKKLKGKHKENLRIYLIKYRKQTQYKHKTTAEEKDFDYSYLDECAGEYSVSSPTPYIYDVETEGDLKSAMISIAKNIKPWAKYEEAKNVE